jgi:hypothetical protein
MFLKIPFLLHIVVETPAAFTFIFTPDRQLQDCSPAARLVLRQYGGLLLTSNLVCLAAIAAGDLGSVETYLAVALGSYHVWPCHRAWTRLTRKVTGDVQGEATLGGPLVHLAVHSMLCLLFAYDILSGIES